MTVARPDTPPREVPPLPPILAYRPRRFAALHALLTGQFRTTFEEDTP